MNFLEAVQKMKEGKKVKRSVWGSTFWYMKPNSGFENMVYQNDILMDGVAMYNIQATDWEVVDEDKYWNLAEHWSDEYRNQKSFDTKTVKKCRDLILKDIVDNFANGNFNYYGIQENIKKRFGDL